MEYQNDMFIINCKGGVNIVTRLWAGQARNCGLIPGMGKRFLFSTASRPAWGPHLASYPMNTRSPFPKGKGPRASISPPSTAEVKNVWSYTFNLSYIIIACFLRKYGDNFIFTFLNYKGYGR
jgi:hypothetical protein